jgi:hypothetical protein
MHFSSFLAWCPDAASALGPLASAHDEDLRAAFEHLWRLVSDTQHCLTRLVGGRKVERMPMWYVFGARYNENYTEEIDGFLHRLDGLAVLGEDEGANVSEARAHGNPFLDCSTLIRQESTAVMAAQIDIYNSDDEARAADEAPAAQGDEELLGSQERGRIIELLFDVMPSMWDQNHGFHIIDIDDPELVEHGEAYVHEQLTSYLAEAFREGSDRTLPPYVREYMERNTVDGVANGWYTGLPAVFLEPLRQRLGFPYQWWGAPID